MTSEMNVIAPSERSVYDCRTVSVRKEDASLRRLSGVFILVLLIAAIGYACFAQGESDRATIKWVSVSLCVVFLIIAVAASGWYFGSDEHRVPFLIGIASFSAACGVGIGFSAQAAFAALVPALAAAYAGTLVCAVNAGRKPGTLAGILSKGSAASGIPLMLGAYFANSINRDVLYPDPRWLLVAVLILIITVGTAFLVARDRKAIPLPLAGAAFGAFIGLATGLSPHPVVAYVAPASLALFAGAASYSFITNEANERRSIGEILFCFGVLLIVGLFLGSVVRLGLGWSGAPRTLFAFGTLLLVTFGFGRVVGARYSEVVSALGFAMLGAGVGLAIGMSQTPVMHVVGPALLTMFAGLASFVFITDADRRKASLGLLAAFGLVVLLGSFVGYSLRDGDLHLRVAMLQQKMDALSDDQHDVVPSEPEQTIAAARVTISQAEVRRHLLIWLEGSEATSAVLIRVGTDWQGVLKITDRVNGDVLYQATPAANDQIAQRGESLEIRWPSDAGRDALAVLGWERLVRVDGNWTVQGDGEEVSTDSAELRGEWFVLIYP